MLIKSSSTAALHKNIATEIRSGRPRDQAVAIAYSVQREAMKKMKKEMPKQMPKGGMHG